MRYLVIDTAFESGIAALFCGEKVVKEIHVPLFANQSRLFFPLLQQLFRDANFPMRTLDFIASGIGPGSYTGMRVGGMICKTLAYALKKPLVGVCSLHGISAETQGSFAALIDARISGAYLLQGVRNGDNPIFESSPQVIEIEAIETSLKDVPVLVTTPGNRIRQRIEARYPSHCWTWEEQHLSSKNLGQAALRAFIQGNYSSDASLDLMYLRPGLK